MSTINFIAQLGQEDKTGLLSLEDRLNHIEPNKNPYLAGKSLPPNSPVFLGRERELHRFKLELTGLNPSHISLIGERRIGKSSLANQIFKSLENEPNLISIYCDAQSLDSTSQKDFFSNISKAICSAINIPEIHTIHEYSEFQRFIRNLAKNYRFSLLIDEFDSLANNTVFDRFFFDNMRNLGNQPENHFGFLIISHTPLKDLCHNGSIAGSAFWNIFDSWTLGLLDDISATKLIIQPFKKSHIKLSISSSVLLTEYGKHPFFLQVALSEIAYSSIFKSKPDMRRIEREVFHAIMQDIWRKRNQQEVKYLFKLIAGKELPNDYITQTLTARGILNDGTFFRKKFILALPPELIPEKISTTEFLHIIKTKGDNALDTADKWIAHFEHIISIAGKIKKAWDESSNSMTPGSP